MTEMEYLNAEKTAILAQLVALAAVPDVSEGGRSISVSATRSSLQQRLDSINQRLAQLSGPFAITSTATTF